MMSPATNDFRIESEAMTIRIGAVSYLNTKPLIYGLSRRLPDASIRLDLPSRLAKRLASGELDVGLIPSIEAFQDPSYRIVSDACIACHGPVWSVKLLSQVPMPEIQSLALDEGSRTSAALARILLSRRFGLEPTMVNWPVRDSLDQVNTDAVLMIGDRAMKDYFPGYSHVWDLGEVWREWTGLPFVFAMWVARDKQHGDIAEKALTDARDDGLDHLANISAMEAPRYGLSEERCLSYLRDDLRFYLRTPERQALQRFQSYAVQAGLAPGRNELTYHGCEVA